MYYLILVLSLDVDSELTPLISSDFYVLCLRIKLTFPCTILTDTLAPSRLSTTWYWCMRPKDLLSGETTIIPLTQMKISIQTTWYLDKWYKVYVEYCKFDCHYICHNHFDNLSVPLLSFSMLPPIAMKGIKVSITPYFLDKHIMS